MPSLFGLLDGEKCLVFVACFFLGVLPASGSSYPVPDSPAADAYSSNTYDEMGWTEVEISEGGLVDVVSVTYTWNTDGYAYEGSFWIRSPSGKTAQIAAGQGDGTYTLPLASFRGENASGLWRLWIEDSYGDGGHQAADITLSVALVDPETPAGLQANYDGTSVEAQWEPPIREDGLQGYHVYRNGVKVHDGLVSLTSYSDAGVVLGGKYCYTVRAVYQGEGPPSNEACVLVASSYALQFNGEDHYVSAGSQESLNITGSLTLEAWIRPHGWGENPMYGFGRIVDKEKFSLLINSAHNPLYNDHSLVFSITNEHGDTIALNTLANTIVLHKWHHVAVTYDGTGDGKIYINAVEQETVQPKGPLPDSIPDNLEHPLLIGESANQNRAFEGEMDRVAIWSVVRSEQQIQSSMENGVTGTEVGLRGYWPIEESAGSLLVDKSPRANHASIHGPEWVEGAPFDELNRIPRNVRSSSDQAGANRLTWTPPVRTHGLHEYIVYRNAVRVGTGMTTTWFEETALSPNVVYCYTVTSVHDGIESVVSCESCTMPHDGVLFVNAAATGADNGSSWHDAFKELQSALAFAKGGDDIWVAAGTYRPDFDVHSGQHTGERMAVFRLRSGVAVYGGFDGTETAREQRRPLANETLLSGDIGLAEDKGDNAVRLVLCGNGTDTKAILDGFTIRDSYSGTDLPTNGGGLHCYNSSPTLSNLVLNANQTAYFGGGIYVEGGNPTLTKVAFSGNSAKWGGGMYAYRSLPILYDVSFAWNFADYGGGIYNTESSLTVVGGSFRENHAGKHGGAIYSEAQSNSTIKNVEFIGNSANQYAGGMLNHQSSPRLSDVVFRENEAKRGGGVYNEYSSCTFRNVSFHQNIGTEFGGGLFNFQSNTEIVNTWFKSNLAKYAGGVYNHTSNPHITNAVFFRNMADDVGGGMFNGADSRPVLTNVTFSENQCPYVGGGMVNFNSNPTVVNSIFWNDTAPMGAEIYDDGGNTSVRYSIVQGGWEGSGNLDADPLFVNAQEADLRLRSGSPAVDAGDRTALPEDTLDIDIDGDTTEPIPLDLSGNPRVVGMGPDMGAYESATIERYELSHVLLILRLLAGAPVGSSCYGLDATGDGRIDSQDLLYILSSVLELRQ